MQINVDFEHYVANSMCQSNLLIIQNNLILDKVSIYI